MILRCALNGAVHLSAGVVFGALLVAASAHRRDTTPEPAPPPRAPEPASTIPPG